MIISPSRSAAGSKPICLPTSTSKQIYELNTPNENDTIPNIINNPNPPHAQLETFPHHQQIPNRLYQHAGQRCHGQSVSRLLPLRLMRSLRCQYHVCSQINPYKIIHDSYRCTSAGNQLAQKNYPSLHPQIHRCQKNTQFPFSFYLVLQQRYALGFCTGAS